ncbi:MAG: signal peptide peptidase SppA [Owenweeksia sp.]
MFFIGFLLIFILFIVLASIASMAEPKIVVKDNSVLRIDLNSVIYERADNNPFASFDPLTATTEQPLGLNEILAALKKAKDDPKIIGVYLDGGIPLTGNATLKEIRDAILDFRAGGKFVYNYSEILTQKGYYLDSIMINPEGFFEWKGLNISVTYLKDAMDKLGLKPEVLRATGNKFKSAVEPYLRQDMSEENRLQLTTLLNSVWNSYTSDISASRELSETSLNDLANQNAVIRPTMAVESGLIHAAVYEDEVMAMLMSRTGSEKAEDIPFISVHRYAESANLSGDASYKADKIAVVIAQGDIVSGRGTEYSIGSERIAEALRKARTNDKIKAVVLRVNSPGGSALASEVIWREVDLLRKKKPVVASMGDLAASGGYYISCFADTIIAQPNTITGSIGAFGLFFTGQELLNDKLGVNIETVPTHQYSDLGTFDRPLTESERALLINSVDNIYQTFKERVAEGRGLSVEFVDSIGQGRVWSGRDALKLGLVDMLGGLDTALAVARKMAGIEGEYRVVEYPEQEDPIMRLLKDLSGDYEERAIRNRLGEFARYFDLAQQAQKMQGYQTRMIYDLQID